MKPNADSGWCIGSAPAGMRSRHTIGSAFRIGSGMPSLSAPIEPYLNCSTAGLRIGVVNRSPLPSFSGGAHCSDSAVCAASGVHDRANAAPTSAP